MIFALPSPSGGRPILRDARVRALALHGPESCPTLMIRAGYIVPVFMAGGQAGPAERAVWSPWPVVCAVSVEHHRRARTMKRCARLSPF